MRRESSTPIEKLEVPVEEFLTKLNEGTAQILLKRP